MAEFFQGISFPEAAHFVSYSRPTTGLAFWRGFFQILGPTHIKINNCRKTATANFTELNFFMAY